jgi:hypothetical protein
LNETPFDQMLTQAVRRDRVIGMIGGIRHLIEKATF